MNLLVSSAGRRNQLLDCFRRDAALLELPLRVYATDANPLLSPACNAADIAFAVPRCTESEFIPAVLEICRREKIDILVPTIDPELSLFSQHIGDFSAEGVRVVVSGAEVVALANNKLTTASRLLAGGISTPKTLMLADYLRDPSRLCGPVIAKPIAGSASFGIIRPRLPDELVGLNPDTYIVQEYWRGREFTVNVFFDRSGHLRCAVPHERLEVRSGEVSKGKTCRLPTLISAAENLGRVLRGASGPLCFQAVVLESGDYAVFEINARFGGGYPLAHQAGATFTKWLLEESAGIPCSANNEWRAGVTMLRYDAAIFTDE